MSKLVKRLTLLTSPAALPQIWWVGFAGVLSGALGDFVALGLASQSLVAALGGGDLSLSVLPTARERVFRLLRLLLIRAHRPMQAPRSWRI